MLWKNLTKDELVQLTDEIIGKLKTTDDLVGNVPIEDASWSSVIKPLLDLEESTNLLDSLITFPQYVSSDKEIRDTSCECTKKFAEAAVESTMRVDVYERVRRVQELMGDD